MMVNTWYKILNNIFVTPNTCDCFKIIGINENLVKKPNEILLKISSTVGTKQVTISFMHFILQIVLF